MSADPDPSATCPTAAPVAVPERAVDLAARLSHVDDH
jgi:hypothetical protein